MSDVASATLGLFAAFAPLGSVRLFLASVSEPDGGEPTFRETALVATLGGAMAFGVLAAAALLSDPFLDAIDVSGSAFLFAGGAAMAPLAARLILLGDSMPLSAVTVKRRVPAWIAPIGTPALAGPSAIVAAVAYAAHYGEFDAIFAAALASVGAAIILALSPAIARTVGELGLGIAGRLSGGLLIAVAVSLAVSGVRNV